MKHLRKFESFSVNEEEGSFRKFFTGHSDPTEKFGTMKTFLTDLDKFEKMAAGNEDIVFNKEKLIQQAKENNYKGGLRIQRGGRDKARMYVIYDEGTSGFQALAASAGATKEYHTSF